MGYLSWRSSHPRLGLLHEHVPVQGLLADRLLQDPIQIISTQTHLSIESWTFLLQRELDSVGIRRVSSAQSSPIASWMSVLAFSKAGGGITICQIRVMFSRSSWPINGNIHATSSGKRSCGTVLAMSPTALPCSGRGTRSLMRRYKWASSFAR